ncbi:MAG: signal recognition particle protein [Ardenticatenia bacterium]|nr:signal recognition particle protein [Ardenticatenia bacterium]
MFDELSQKLQHTFDRLAGRGRLTEKDVDTAMREVKLALLEADVNFKVVREFVQRVKEKAIGEEILKSLTPAQVVVKIVHDELIELLGEPSRLNVDGPPPAVIMLVGLQGSGKTTTAGKLANWLRQQGRRPLLVAADTYRPAAVRQLQVLGEQLGIPVHAEGIEPPPPEIAERAVHQAKRLGHDVVIIDTAGRLQVNEALMEELEEIKRRVAPREILLVADAMTGQEAVNVARTFHERVGLTGVIFTKVDGDARGGAALSIRKVTGVPIKFLGVGEKLDALEPFHPDRLASRILGMGDVLTLVEKAQQTIDVEKAQQLEQRLMEGKFDLEDFLEQLQQLKKMGPITQLLDLIPGFSGLKHQIPLDVTERELRKIEAIINSMTREERRHPQIINASRKRRIARGSGTTVQEVNQLLKQFRMMQRMIREMTGKGRGRKPRLPFQLPPGFGL